MQLLTNYICKSGYNFGTIATNNPLSYFEAACNESLNLKRWKFVEYARVQLGSLMQLGYFLSYTLL